MLKTFCSSVVLLFCAPVMATEITSPFYMPKAGHILNKTEANYTKNKMKGAPLTRTYRRAFNNELTLGMGGGIAVQLGGELDWTRQKQTTTLSVPHQTSYDAGLKGQWETGDFLTQISALYHQTDAVKFAARRELEAHVRLGKPLQTMTPYLHLAGSFPLNARPDFNAPLYRGETGVFQPINDKMTLDSALYLQYDKNIRERSYGIRGEWSYLPTSWVAISLNGEWQARGKARAGAKTYHQFVGVKMTFAF
ncbi:MAG: hypothetical protein ACI4OR_00445 [Alphaproteobacteria bacterium]